MKLMFVFWPHLYQRYLLNLECACNAEGSTNPCDASGTCTCKDKIEGASCDKCIAAHYGFPTCQGINKCYIRREINFTEI